MLIETEKIFMKILLKILKWLGIILAVSIVLLFFLTSFVINRYKGEAEQAIARQLGINAQIEGNLQLKILPGFSLVVNKLNLISNETYFLRSESVEFSIDMKSFFLGPNLIVTAIHLKNPQFFIFKTEKGKFNFEPESENSKYTGSPVTFNLSNIAIEAGKFLYFDTKQKDTLFLTGIDLATKQIRATGNFRNFSFKNTYFEGIAKIGQINLNALHLKNLQFKVIENNEQLLVTPERSEFYGGRLSGKASIDLSSQFAETDFNFVASGIKIDSLLMDFETALYLGGKVDLQADLQLSGFDWDEMKKNLNGNLSISGDNVTIYGFEPKVVLSNYFQTGEFNAVNASAALTAGPLGAIFLNNKALAKLLANNSGDSMVARHFISNWKFENGNALADDVAFSDNKYRFAVSGKLNCLEKSYQNFDISLLNKSGCAIITQQLKGDFQTAVPITISSIDNKNISQNNLQEAVLSRVTCLTPYMGAITNNQ